MLSWERSEEAEPHIKQVGGQALSFVPAGSFAVHGSARTRLTTSDALNVSDETMTARRQCCRFLRFGMTVEPDRGPIALELTGPSGTREFLSALLDA